jgi:hypothetical protein
MPVAPKPQKPAGGQGTNQPQNPALGANGVVAAVAPPLTPPASQYSQTISGEPAPAGCAYALSGNSANVGAASQIITVSVATAAGCGWSATTSAPWMTINRSAQAAGGGSIEVIVAAKRSAGVRTGEVRIGSATLTVSQTGTGGPGSRSWDVDGDGRSDMGVWRPETGHWFVRASSSPSSSPFTRDWGGGEFGDKPAPGDYDGDGRGDLAVWRAGEGRWRVLQSSSNYTDYLDIPIAGPDGLPMPADYDGDGRTDVGVWQSAKGLWSVKTSTTSFADGFSIQMENGGDTPVTGDYDGDGRADLAMWRPATGLWSIRLSHMNYAASHVLSFQLARGSGTDEPVSGDFDGDGASDIAIWRKASGGWQILFSDGGFSATTSRVVAISQSARGDRPVPGDYDGDGKTDVAMWRQAENLWQVTLSMSSFLKTDSIQFGNSSKGDGPVK